MWVLHRGEQCQPGVDAVSNSWKEMKEESCLPPKSAHPPYEQVTLSEGLEMQAWLWVAQACREVQWLQAAAGLPTSLARRGAGTFSAQRKPENRSETHIKSVSPGRLYAATGNAG